MLTVSQLYIYPVKSLAGIAVQSALVTDRGFQYDRRWMLVDEQNRFMTQREHPAMALLKTSIQGGDLKISSALRPDSTILVPLSGDSASGDAEAVQVWSDRVRARTVSSLADDWLSDILSFSCRLVFMPEDTRRRVDGRYARNKDITSFTDGYPFMMIGQASLDDLNSRMTQSLPIDRFRPSIVFSGGTPFEEDGLEHFTISGIDFYGVKLCARCTVTTIDQQTATGGKEPLKTLASYRKKNNRIYFGQNLLSMGQGMVKTGDLLHVVTRKKGRFEESLHPG